MIELVDKFRTLPGGFSNINPFDVVYSAISVSLVGLFGRTVPLLDRLGLSLDDKWQPGKPLKILLLAYSGARNTGAESRVSNFLLWQIAYSELYITDVMWPDFRAENFQLAIRDYQSRERRFGLTSEQVRRSDAELKQIEDCPEQSGRMGSAR